MHRELLPLLSHADLDAPLVWRGGKPIPVRRFLQQARSLAQRLPQGDYAINLCEDRYHFLLAFVAMLLRRQVNLLPANRSAGEVASVSARFGHCPCIVDARQSELGQLPQHVVTPEDGADEVQGVPQLEPEQLCAVVFTSGSSGESVPWEKRWGELCHGARLTREMLGLDRIQPLTLVATVPPQHMYGLETTVLLPLVAGLAVEGGRPFFPHDLLDTLRSLPGPRLLVTTPVHLKVCLDAELDWPPLAQILSATAPLTAELARRAEEQFGCPLQEIYGSTETGAVAVRRPREESEWRLYRGLQLQPLEAERVSLQGGHLRRAVVLNDRLRPVAADRFLLLGRSSDMVKIAGKRVSLGDLNHKLLAIPGVEDGVFVDRGEGNGAVGRLCAVVVAPGLGEREIIEALRSHIDPVCLPRPLYRVASLPRNGAGKLPRQALMQLLKDLRSG